MASAYYYGYPSIPIPPTQFLALTHDDTVITMSLRGLHFEGQ